MLYLNHSPINFYFSFSPRDFIVEEIPLYEFCGSGEHAIFKIRKESITTADLIKLLAKRLKIETKHIGYAGLKDKHSLSYQYISVNKRYDKDLIDILNAEDNIKIIDKTYHINKIKLGHLSSNKFFIRIKKLDKLNAMKVGEVCKTFLTNGMPNYFGPQRFGINNNNYEEGKAILEGRLKVNNLNLKRLLINSFQSHLFNRWLNERIEISKLDENKREHFFKLLRGDHFIRPVIPPIDTEDEGLVKLEGRLNDEQKASLFYKKQLLPSGLLCGINNIYSSLDALAIEEKYLDDLLLNAGEKFKDLIRGSRRAAWIFLYHLEFKYKDKDAHGEINLTLPKGSYASSFLTMLKNDKV